MIVTSATQGRDATFSLNPPGSADSHPNEAIRTRDAGDSARRTTAGPRPARCSARKSRADPVALAEGRRGRRQHGRENRHADDEPDGRRRRMRQERQDGHDARPDRHPDANGDHERQHQHRRVEPREADANPVDVHLTAAAKHHADDESGETDDRQIDESARPHPPHGRRPRLDAEHRVAGHESGHQQAVDRVVGVAQKGPGHRRPRRARQPQCRLRIDPEHQPAEDRERRGERQAEVLGRARAHER